MLKLLSRLRFCNLPIRAFSSQPQREEYKVNEKEVFSEEKMAEARASIKEKLRQISQEETTEPAKSRHDPRDFEFTQQHRIQQERKGPYFYSKPLKFPPGKDSIVIYEMNTDIYETGNVVDGLVSAALIFSTYKLAR